MNIPITKNYTNIIDLLKNTKCVLLIDEDLMDNYNLQFLAEFADEKSIYEDIIKHISEEIEHASSIIDITYTHILLTLSNCITISFTCHDIYKTKTTYKIFGYDNDLIKQMLVSDGFIKIHFNKLTHSDNYTVYNYIH